jgi:hypothetical protein
LGVSTLLQTVEVGGFEGPREVVGGSLEKGAIEVRGEVRFLDGFSSPISEEQDRLVGIDMIGGKSRGESAAGIQGCEEHEREIHFMRYQM